jgi:hypothetical protein
MFVQSQMIPWREGLHGDARRDVESKLLSLDDTDGSSTCIVRYPPGWNRTAPQYLSIHEEFLILDGCLVINGRRYEQHHYGFLPAGYPRERSSSEHGAVVLTMFYGKPSLGTGSTPGFDPKLLVEHVDPLSMDWDPGLVDPQLSKGVAIKPLRTDPYTGTRCGGEQ